MVYGAFGGRIDQTVSVIFSLAKHNLNCDKDEMILMDTYSLMIYLAPGDHVIIPSGLIESKVGCGFYPICAKSSMVATDGLKWNVGVYSQPER